ncbi:MAG: hypothetical protein JXB48_23765 [Candidatus Latescibacteria bacterium]|nr:hypothetical protein [Candidatus Latescibacterota bacterium]
MKTIIVPVDGATNIKLEVLDYETLQTVFTRESETPVTEVNGLVYNCTGKECQWFDSSILDMPEHLKTVKVIAPVSRGASGGLIGFNNTLVEVPGENLTLSYTQAYPDRVEEAFRELVGDDSEFFLETGSVREFPGSIILLKRFLYEEMERPDLLNHTEYFGTYGSLLTAHFIGDNYLKAVLVAGNEHSYWMCHTGARNINKKSGTNSSYCERISTFNRLVPFEPSLVYNSIGSMPYEQSLALGLYGELQVVPGGHDTCLSHIPIMSTYYHVFEDQVGTSVVHIDAGSWTMIAQIGGGVKLPPDGYRRDIVVQGTVDGQPVVTARYGGGNDFKYIKELIESHSGRFDGVVNEKLLEETVRAADCFVLPNINPINHLTGPFPNLKGEIINESVFFEDPKRAYIIANLTTALITAFQIEAVTDNDYIPLVLTGGGAKDVYFGRLLATITGRQVYALEDCNGKALSETTTLGAAIVGKAACLPVHPYRVDISSLGIAYRNLSAFGGEIKRQLEHYRNRFFEEIRKHHD